MLESATDTRPARPVSGATIGGGLRANVGHRRGRPILFVDEAGWIQLCYLALLVTALAFPAYRNDSLWLAPGVFIVTFAAGHVVTAARRAPWLGSLFVLIAGVQGVLATWAAYHLPTTGASLPMALAPDAYFAFEVPALLAMSLGIAAPALMLRSARVSPSRFVSHGVLRRTSDRTILAGLVARVVLTPLLPGSLVYFAWLVYLAAFAAAASLMVARTAGWRSRVALMLAVEAGLGAIDGIFNTLLTFVLLLLMLGMFSHRIPLRRLLPAVGLAGVLLLVINAFKGDYRTEATSQALSTSARLDLAARRFVGTASDPSLLFTAENLSFNVHRFNQGGITARIISWTPSREPFAGGSTISDALYAAVVPRVLDAGKYVAGGKELYPRFTGLPLLGGTSINLSVPGEMYANFGVAGAWVGMFAYGLLLGLVMRFFAVKAQTSPVWWAWQLYVLFAAASAESAVGEVLNHLTKSSVVFGAILLISPSWRRIMLPRARRAAA